MTSSIKYKIGIIGAGAIVENSHLPVLLNLCNVDISWIYDIDFSRTQLLSNMYNVPVLKNLDIESAIDKLDICLITIPYGVRDKYISLCAKKKKAIYVEKPFAISLEEHKRYCEMFEKHKLAIGFQRRYYKIVYTLKSIIQSEIFGKLKKVSFKQGYFSLKGGSGFVSNASLSVGGVIIESAIHALDQILLITSAQSVNVNEIRSLNKAGIDYDTAFMSTLQTDSGLVKIDCEISNLRNLDNGLILTFENCMIKCSLGIDATSNIFNIDGELLNLSIDKIDTGQSMATSIGASFYLFWNDFINALDTKQDNISNGNSSLLTTEWIEQIYKSIKD